MNRDPIRVTLEALARHGGEPGVLLPTLHAIQDRPGHVPPAVLLQVAEALNLSRAEPPGRHVVQVCRAEACQAMGAEALLAHAERWLGCLIHVGHGSTGADSRYTLTPVFCLGLCASAPTH